MNITNLGIPESQLRMIVREVIDRHIGRDPKFVQVPVVSSYAGLSFTRFHLNGSGSEVPCLIESSVRFGQFSNCRLPSVRYLDNRPQVSPKRFVWR